MNEAPRSNDRLGTILSALFLITMTLGAGPGVLLVNRPTMLFGIPLVYAWAIFWYFVLVTIALVAFFCLWNRTDEESE